MQSRAATIQLRYLGRDISGDIAPFVKSFAYTDNAHGQADDLRIDMDDRDHLWKGDWLPRKGDTVSASIICLEGWDGPGSSPVSIPCGSFQVDEVEISVGSGDTISLKAVSSMTQNTIRKEVKTRAWENGSLRQVFLDISEQAGFELSWQADDVQFSRLDQRAETDIAFMKRVADEFGLNLKINDATIIVFAGERYDAKPASFSISRGQSNLRTLNLRTKATDVYKACEVSYHDPKDKQLKTYTFTPPDSPAGSRVLRVNQIAEDVAMAEKKAKAALRKKNQQEVEGDVALMGEPRLLAGMNLSLSGFRRFDGIYAVEQVRHGFDRSAGYTTSAKIRKTLTW
ncbi:phage late control D family protein [Oceanidesulfovibrio marinus]|uniref:Phage protein D n=1 Tax=Oceanidesulfovibrio marinus TaxID=370038 RepID=A0ABX6NI44_9BACT|nr:hypothetical protein [Oceanidesulfovibrio marinus]QJT10228.1 hypothetical protein E8L03_15390 [Oceanidesulfovibrio marinus]